MDGVNNLFEQRVMGDIKTIDVLALPRAEKVQDGDTLLLVR